MAAGPASIGTASGVIAISSLLLPAAVSSAVSWTADRCARNISSATKSKTSAPATWMAGNVIPKRLNNVCPTSAKLVRSPTITRQATRAIRSRCATVSRDVIATKAGTAATGSTITKRELKANNAYSVNVISDPLRSGQQLGAGVRMLHATELVIQLAILFRDGGRHHDLQNEKQIAMSTRSRRQPFPFQTKLAFGTTPGRYLHANRLTQRRRHHVGSQGCLPRPNWKGHMKVTALPVENPVRFDQDLEIEISSFTAVVTGLSLPRHPNPRSLLDARRNLDLDCFGLQANSAAQTGGTGTPSQPAAPLAS